VSKIIALTGLCLALLVSGCAKENTDVKVEAGTEDAVTAMMDAPSQARDVVNRVAANVEDMEVVTSEEPS